MAPDAILKLAFAMNHHQQARHGPGHAEALLAVDETPFQIHEPTASSSKYEAQAITWSTLHASLRVAERPVSCLSARRSGGCRDESCHDTSVRPSSGITASSISR